MVVYSVLKSLSATWPLRLVPIDLMVAPTPLSFLAAAIGGVIVLDDFSQPNKFHNFVEQNDPVM